MNIHIYFVSYNGMSFGPFSNTIGTFLLNNYPENIGEAVKRIDVYIRFRSAEPPLPTLDSMKENFELGIEKLPLFWFRRKRNLFEITYVSESCSVEQVTECLEAKTNYEVFNSLCKETVAALKLPEKRIKKSDDFKFDLFFKHISSRLNYLPSNNIELTKLIEK